MANFVIFLGVYGTAIIFNQTIETLASHALATNKLELSGHILNRAMFLWLFIFGALFAGMYNIDKILILALEYDEDDAAKVQEYLIHAAPGFFFWGVVDAHRRWINCH